MPPSTQSLESGKLTLVVCAGPTFRVGGFGGVLELDEGACGLARTLERNIGSANARVLEFRDHRQLGRGRDKRNAVLEEPLKLGRKRRLANVYVS